jgi:hypothetical protein
MSIKQFNATYLAPDDRVLFRFNTADDAEYRFWFTRRITLFILSVTQHLMVKKLEKKHAPDIAKAIAQYDEEVMKVDPASKGVSRNEEYRPASKYPLGADAILVMEAKCVLEKQGEDDGFSLDLILPGGANINLKMAVPVLQAMCSLLDQLCAHAEWGVVPQVADTAPNKEANETQSQPTNLKTLLH